LRPDVVVLYTEAMPDPITIVVGTRDLLVPLHARPDVTGIPVQLFPPDDMRAALEMILGQRPKYLVLDQEFSRSGRGTAMIDRLHADPGFASTEILVVAGGTVGPVAVTPGPAPAPGELDWRGTRRTPRIRIMPGTEVQVDGAAAQLVDLSVSGAQVVSGSPLRPSQRVRFGLPSEVAVRMVATVVWANFELPKGRPTPQYRAGLEFSSPNTAALERCCRAYACVEETPASLSGR
jgi:hypothetical protein